VTRRHRTLLAWASVVCALYPAVAWLQPRDVERALAERFGFSSAELGQVAGGQLVVKTLPASDPVEMGALGVVRIRDDKDRLVRWVQDVEGFRKAAELGISRKLSSPPAIGDFGDLALDAAELASLQRCRPGSCDLRLGDQAIARFQELDWTAPDAGRRANLLLRQLMLHYSEAYLRGGDEALGTAHDQAKPRVVADQFRALYRSSTNLYALARPLATYLERFPRAELPGSQQFLYWAKGGAGPEPLISLHHLVIQRDPSGQVFIADKGLYSSRYSDAGLLVLWLEAPPDGKGYYVLAGVRARSPQLDGFAARMLRGRVEEEARSYLGIYLDWLRRSLAPA
jgi:hypothetical protein